MKKFILSLLALTFTLCGCAKTVENTSESNPENSESSAVTEEVVSSEEETTVNQEDLPEWLRDGPKPTEREREIVSEEDFEYEVMDGGAVVTKYLGESESVDIPELLGGVPVKEVGFYAFEAKHNVTSVTIPETVTLIGEGAFMDCNSLQSVNIPEAVKGIDRGAFVGCASLTDITIPSAVTYIQEEAFTGCMSLQTLTINNPDLEYQAWGLEGIPDLQIISPEGSAVSVWASEIMSGESNMDYGTE